MKKKKTYETEASGPSDISKPLRGEGNTNTPEEKHHSEHAREIDTERLNKIAEETFFLIKNVDIFDDSGITSTRCLQTLVRSMEEEQLAVVECEIIFSELLAALEKLERLRINEDYEQPSLELELAQSYIKETKQAAIDYFYNIIKPDLPEDLTERYVYLKKELDYHDENTGGWYPFYVEALNKLKKETEKIREDIKDAEQFRADVQSVNPVKNAEEEIFLLEKELSEKNKEINELKERLSKSVTNPLDEQLRRELTAKQWLIATGGFLRHFNLTNALTKTEVGTFLAILNGGKHSDYFRKKLYSKLITKDPKIIADTQAVANLFRKFELDSIADDIENEIQRIND